jgi:hypothetical protein
MNCPEIIQCFSRVLPYVNELLVGDAGVTLTDTEKYLLAKPGKKLDLKINPGDPLKPGSAVYRAINEKKRIIIRADKSFFGIPYIAVAIPLFDQTGKIVGAASIQESVDRQETLKQMSATLNDNISVIASTLEEITAQAEGIASTSKKSTKVAQDSYARIQETNQILTLINSITSQTNLLGLNAAIESARVGDQGRGFGVVAQEIRKLATTSAESIKKIETVIEATQQSSNQQCKQMEQIDTIIIQITEAITYVTGAIQQTSTMAQELEKIADCLAED